MAIRLDDDDNNTSTTPDQEYDASSTTTVDQLDDDALKLVFRRLSLQEKSACQLVCRRWNRLVNEMVAGQQVLCLYDHSSIVMSKLKCRYHRFEGNENVDDKKLEQMLANRQQLSSFLTKMPNIKSIYIGLFTFSSMEQFHLLFEKCPKITCISIYVQHIYHHAQDTRKHVDLIIEMARDYGHRIKHAHFECPFHPVVEDDMTMVIEAVQQMSNLAKLLVYANTNLNVDYKLGNNFINSIAQSKSLNDLHFGQIQMANCIRLVDDLTRSGQSQSIRQLHFNVIDHFDDEDIVCDVKNLKKLCEKLNRHFPSLETLTLKLNAICGPSIVFQFPFKFSTLKRLEMVRFTTTVWPTRRQLGQFFIN